MGRPPLEKKQRQLAVALPEEARSHLETAAKASGRSIAEEIRRRLALTFEQDALDPVTREMLEGLERIAASLRQVFGAEWYADSRVHEGFMNAVAQRLDRYAPPPTDILRGSAASELLGESELAASETVKAIARLREKDDLIQRFNNYPQLAAIESSKAQRVVSRFAKDASKKENSDE
jgi:hypothetical protein